LLSLIDCIGSGLARVVTGTDASDDEIRARAQELFAEWCEHEELCLGEWKIVVRTVSNRVTIFAQRGDQELGLGAVEEIIRGETSRNDSEAD